MSTHGAVRMRASDTHFFLQDANFNVTTAVEDSTNNVVERYSYTPYGEVTVLDDNFAADADNKSDIGNVHLYTRRERDPETGLPLNRHRYYAHHLGRWVTRDPIGYEGSEWNLYEYVYSRPTNEQDPSGQERWWAGGPGQVCVDTSCSQPIAIKPAGPPFQGWTKESYVNPGQCKPADGAFGIDEERGPVRGIGSTFTRCKTGVYKTGDGCTTRIRCEGGKVRAFTTCGLNPAAGMNQRLYGGCDPDPMFAIVAQPCEIAPQFP